MTDYRTHWQKAKEILETGEFTCVLCRGDAVFTATERGVKPLVRFLESGERLRQFCAADKVVGKATACLYVLLGVRCVYARVMSRSAAQVLAENGIETEYDTLVENIINRRGDGICPFEAAVLPCQEPHLAYAAIREKMAALRISL